MTQHKCPTCSGDLREVVVRRHWDFFGTDQWHCLRCQATHYEAELLPNGPPPVIGGNRKYERSAMVDQIITKEGRIASSY